MSSGVVQSSVVESVGRPVTPEDIDILARQKALELQQVKVTSVLTAWTAQEQQYLSSRKLYAGWIVGAMLVQAVLVNIAFFLIGCGTLHIEPWVANTFILSVFGQMVSLALIVFKYFFPSNPSRLTQIVENL